MLVFSMLLLVSPSLLLTRTHSLTSLSLLFLFSDFVEHHLDEEDAVDRPAIQACKHLYEQEESSGRSLRGGKNKKKKPVPKLHDLETIAGFLSKPIFCLREFQEKTELLVLQWNLQVFGDHLPTLIRHGYRMPQLPAVPPVAAAASSATRTTTHDSNSSNRRRKKKQKDPTPEEILQLRENRDKLNHEHGDDPLEQARAMANEIVAGNKNSKKKRQSGNKHQLEEQEEDMSSDDDEEGGDDRRRQASNKKKRRHSSSKHRDDGQDDDAMLQDDDEDGKKAAGSSKKNKRAQLVIEDDDDDEEEESSSEDEQERAQLSEIPSKSNVSKPKSKKKPPPAVLFGNCPPDEGLFDGNGKVTRRVKWSDAEKTAIKEGVKIYGTGQWKQIKCHERFEETLHNRTSVQIKDKWRTMLNHNEIDFEYNIEQTNE